MECGKGWESGRVASMFCSLSEGVGGGDVSGAVGSGAMESDRKLPPVLPFPPCL
jgi:hypothetical protein